MFDRYMTTFEQGTNYEVEAVELTAENVKEVAVWCHGYEVLEHDALDPEKTYPGLNVHTEKGNRRASQGDFIIKGPLGDFHVHSGPIFKLLYQGM